MFKTAHQLRLWALAVAGMICLSASLARGQDPWVVYEGKDGPGKGKHVVLIAGDDEYRSEELIPQLARILAVRQGFTCTVLFAVSKQTGEIDPSTLDNIPGLEKLKDADLMILFLRWRELPDDQMKCIMDYTNSGKPIIGLRTSTHPFNYRTHKESPYAKYTYNGKDPKGGYGRMVFGETWITHYGAHAKESTRGLVAPGMENNPIVRGCEDIWGPSDVYGLTTLEGECTPVILGQVLAGMDPKDKPNPEKNLVPVAWTKTFKGAEGKASRVFTTTMGHVDDLRSEGFRRLLANACFWALDMQDKTPARANVDLVGEYKSSPIGMGKARKGLKPSDLKL